MKRIAILWLLLFATSAEAQIKQITGGGYQNSNGTACAGCILYLQLPVDATVTGTGQIVPNLNSYTLDANGNVPANSNLWANDQLTPSGLTYKATLTLAGGGRIWGPEFLSIAGISPISLTQLVPVASSSVFFGNPAILTQNNTFTGTQTFSNLIVSGTGTFTGGVTATFNSGKPWYDVTDPTYGAKCDGVTNDTAAVQAALTAANTAQGGRVVIPNKTTPCQITGQLVMDNFHDVELVGLCGGRPNGGAPSCWLRFSGTTTPFISCKSCFGVFIRGLYLQYTGAPAGGDFISLVHSGLAVDSTGNRIQDNFIGKQAAGGSLTNLINLDQAGDTIIDNNQFYDATNAIAGPASSGSYSIGNHIINDIFGLSGVLNLNCAINNPGSAWTISRDDFELGNGVGMGVVCGGFGGPTAGVEISNNFMGDAANTETTPLISIAGGTNGWRIHTNLAGCNSANADFISVAGNNATGIQIESNYTSTGATCRDYVNMGANTGTVLRIGTNGYPTLTAFLGGTPGAGSDWIDNNNVRNIKASGTILDNAGAGRLTFTSANTFIGTSGSANTVFLGGNGKVAVDDSPAVLRWFETTAPSGTAAWDSCYGDSTAHALKCNYNNATNFLPMQQVISTSLTTTAATTDNVTVTGMTSTGHCYLTPTNSGAAGGIASVFISAKTTNQITVTHTATSGWTFDVVCTPQ